MRTKWRGIGQSIFAGIAVGLGAFIVTAVYKWMAEWLTNVNEKMFAVLRMDWRFVLPAIPLFVLIAWLLSRLYCRFPDAMGGGIPNCIAELRGVAQFDAAKALLGTFFLSLSTFLLGVPLGTEGSCVLLGAALGKWGSQIKGMDEKRLVVAGACAGFCVATGSPFAAVLFAFEEFSNRPSRDMLIMAATAVLTACGAARLLFPKAGLSVGLFPPVSALHIGYAQWWRVLLFAVGMGFFAWLFLKVYQQFSYFLRECEAGVPLWIKMSTVLLATLAFGVCSHRFIAGGTSLVLSLLHAREDVKFLLALVVIRMLLSICANTVGFCGGTFVPSIAVGTTFAAVLLFVLGVPATLDTAFLCLGITACVAGILQMPLTAVAFTLEVLGCWHLLIPVAVTAAVSFSVAKALRAKSINEITLSYKKKK